MSLWWLQPGWTEASCAHCGSRIWPEGDPDWGLCWPCMEASTEVAERQRQFEADDEAERRKVAGWEAA